MTTIGYRSKTARNTMLALVIVITAAGAFTTSASANPYGECKERVLQKFGTGVLTQDFEKMLGAINDQAGCDSLMTSEDQRMTEGFRHAQSHMEFMTVGHGLPNFFQ
jgi:hypothetical protein